MNQLIRGVGSILLAALLLSCGGGSTDKSVLSQDHRARALFAEVCADVLVVGMGSGVEVEASDSSTPNLPDFAVEKIWLETLAGAENYAYGIYETVNIKAQFKNIGSANTSSSIQVRFYLSKGYKEDSHSEWIHVGTETIQGSNLETGETHTETEDVNLRDHIVLTTTGVYNFVACIDRTQNNNNGSGSIAEEHESNNCSTEAVFTVARRNPTDRKKFMRNLQAIIND